MGKFSYSYFDPQVIVTEPEGGDAHFYLAVK